MLKKLITKYREIIAYLIVGGITTLSNWITYSILVSVFSLNINIANILAWLVAVLVAFFLNKTVVFMKKGWQVKQVTKEFAMFFGSRVLSGIVEIGLVPILIAIGITGTVFGVEGFVAKLIASVFSVIISYVLSKKAVFKNK